MSQDKLKILVVDDDGISQLLLRSIMKRYTEETIVHVVENGGDAIEKASNYDYDIVLMDIEMPGIDGIETGKRLRENIGDKLIIIGVTIDVELKTKKEALANGFNGWVVKPITEEKIMSEIKRCIAS